MKLPFIFLLTVIFTAAGCASSQSSGNDNPQEGGSSTLGVITDDHNTNQTLADFLRQISGVTVSGTGNNVKVTIRGVSSFRQSTEPIYVIDGQIVGNSYSQVNSMISVRDIQNVRALKGSDASMYGVRGGNGVILITTKK